MQINTKGVAGSILGNRKPKTPIKLSNDGSNGGTPMVVCYEDKVVGFIMRDCVGPGFAVLVNFPIEHLSKRLRHEHLDFCRQALFGDSNLSEIKNIVGSNAFRTYFPTLEEIEFIVDDLCDPAADFVLSAFKMWKHSESRKEKRREIKAKAPREIKPKVQVISEDNEVIGLFLDVGLVLSIKVHLDNGWDYVIYHGLNALVQFNILSEGLAIGIEEANESEMNYIVDSIQNPSFDYIRDEFNNYSKL